MKRNEQPHNLEQGTDKEERPTEFATFDALRSWLRRHNDNARAELILDAIGYRVLAEKFEAGSDERRNNEGRYQSVLAKLGDDKLAEITRSLIEKKVARDAKLGQEEKLDVMPAMPKQPPADPFDIRVLDIPNWIKRKIAKKPEA